MIEKSPDDLLEDTCLHRNGSEGPAMRMQWPIDALRTFQMTGARFRCRKHPLPTQPAQRLEEFLVQIKNGKIERTAVLRHRQVDAVPMHILPAQSQCLGFSKPGEKQQPVVRRVDWVLESINDPAPLREIINDPPIRVFRVPLDREGRGFRQIMRAPCVVPDGAEVPERVIGRSPASAASGWP